MDLHFLTIVLNYILPGITVFMGVLAIDSTIREKEYRGLALSLSGVSGAAGIFVFFIIKRPENT